MGRRSLAGCVDNVDKATVAEAGRGPWPCFVEGFVYLATSAARSGVRSGEAKQHVGYVACWVFAWKKTACGGRQVRPG